MSPFSHESPRRDPERQRGGPRADAAEHARRFYDSLHSIARMILRGERFDLRATELANETWIRRASKLFDEDHPGVAFAQMSTWTRHTLIEIIRAERAQKRGGELVRIPIDSELADVPAEVRECDPERLHDALKLLEDLDPRELRIVSLHVFGGLSLPEVAKVLDISLSTAQRDWSHARVWLQARLTDPRSGKGDGAPE